MPLERQSDFSKAIQRLLEQRAKRIRPGLDDKVLVSWNALMIQSMAQAGVILNEPRYLNAAVQASEFILQHMTNSTAGESLRLLHSWRHGKAKLNAYLDDYSYLANAYTTLYECTADSQWLDQAVALTVTAL